jgi:hypothetical protein
VFLGLLVRLSLKEKSELVLFQASQVKQVREEKGSWRSKVTMIWMGILMMHDERRMEVRRKTMGLQHESMG